MMLESVVRDCLYLNWALPAAALPPPPAPLRYQLHPFQGEDHVFASAVLFHQEGLHLQSLPRLRLSYPQCNLRLYVLDGDGVPAVLFRSMLMPLWVVPGVRLVSAQPAASARFRFPRPSSDLGDGEWRWWVEKGEALEVRAWQDSPTVGHGPRLGSWEQTVEYISERPRGYAVEDGALHRVKAQHPRAAVWPLRAEISALGLLTSLLPLTHGAAWPPLHSSWLCPEIPFVFDLGLVPKMAVAPSLPQAAASRSAARSAARIALPESNHLARDARHARHAREANPPGTTPALPAREEEVCHA
jgi:uncharacterized protein YqjF (DUF2071 family)